MIKRMLDQLNSGNGIATAGKQFNGFPTIHELHSGANDPEVVHCGFGFFKGSVDDQEFTFDGGGAMRRGEYKGNDISWTPVRGSKECLEYQGINIKNQIATLKELSNGDIK